MKAGIEPEVGSEKAKKGQEERRGKRTIRIVVLVLVIIVSIIVVISYFSLTSSSDPDILGKITCTVIILIAGTIIFELLMKPQLGLYDPNDYEQPERTEPETEKKALEPEGSKAEKEDKPA